MTDQPTDHRNTQLGDWLPAGFVVITFTADKDETCPLSNCVIGAVRFDHQREAFAYVRSLSGDIDHYPHVIPLNRIATAEDVE